MTTSSKSTRRLHDSSKTRVVPVLDALLQLDPTGAGWLPTLLELPEREGAPSVGLPAISELTDWAWGINERRLPAPKTLLQHLARTFGAAHPQPLPETTPARVERERLRTGDLQALADALAGIDSGAPERAWYVFEGPTQPDGYLETPEVVVVIEGKRTEHGPTRHTDWMSCRDQMLRHLDAALDCVGERPLFGFYVVEGAGGGDAVDVPDHWARAVAETVSAAVLEPSLPHRSSDERERIAGAFLGATTWQAVCRSFGIPWGSLPDRSVPSVPVVRSSEGVPLRILGVDGFGSRWLGVLAEAADERDRLRYVSAEVFADFAAVIAWADRQGVGVVAIDVPIGLPDEEDPDGIRAADRAAIDALKGRRRSLFPMPPADILSLPWEAANEASKVRFKRGLSKQSHALAPKVFDVARHASPGRRVVEIHPELSFRELLGGPAEFPKRTINGQSERLRALEGVGLTVPPVIHGPAGLAPVDDILDACAAAWSALRVARGHAASYPTDPPVRNGREIAIWA
jgi:predicted RNase H-like nuclease